MTTQKLHTEDIPMDYNGECGLFRIKRRIHYTGYFEYGLGDNDLAIIGTPPSEEVIKSMENLLLDFIDNIMDLDYIMSMFRIPEEYRDDIASHNFGCYSNGHMLNSEVGYIEIYLGLDILTENKH